MGKDNVDANIKAAREQFDKYAKELSNITKKAVKKYRDKEEEIDVINKAVFSNFSGLPITARELKDANMADMRRQLTVDAKEYLKVLKQFETYMQSLKSNGEEVEKIPYLIERYSELQKDAQELDSVSGYACSLNRTIINNIEEWNKAIKNDKKLQELLKQASIKRETAKLNEAKIQLRDAESGIKEIKTRIAERDAGFESIIKTQVISVNQQMSQYYSDVEKAYSEVFTLEDSEMESRYQKIMSGRMSKSNWETAITSFSEQSEKEEKKLDDCINQKKDFEKKYADHLLKPYTEFAELFERLNCYRNQQMEATISIKAEEKVLKTLGE